MVHIELPSLSVSLDAGDADVLEKVVSSISSDAVITISNTPTDPTHSNTLLSLLQSIEFRNLNSSSIEFDDIRFRISETNYGRLAQYMTDVFTPEWANTDAGDVDNTNDALIRAKKDNQSNSFSTNTMTMAVAEGSVDAPGNFDGSEHGSFPDLHIGYVAAALTNAHEGRAVILNEESVFDTMNSSFGADFMSSLWSNTSGVTAGADSGGAGYRQLDLEGGSAGPLKELLSALYHGAPERFQTATPNDTEVFQALPIEAGDTVSIRVTVTGNIKMSTSSLTTPASDGADILPLIIPTASKANPSTYQAPFNVVSGVSPDAASDTAVAIGAQELSYVAGVSHNGSNAVSLDIRPQKYEFKVVLGDSGDGSGITIALTYTGDNWSMSGDFGLNIPLTTADTDTLSIYNNITSLDGSTSSIPYLYKDPDTNSYDVPNTPHWRIYNNLLQLLNYPTLLSTNEIQVGFSQEIHWTVDTAIIDGTIFTGHTTTTIANPLGTGTVGVIHDSSQSSGKWNESLNSGWRILFYHDATSWTNPITNNDTLQIGGVTLQDGMLILLNGTSGDSSFHKRNGIWRVYTTSEGIKQPTVNNQWTTVNNHLQLIRVADFESGDSITMLHRNRRFVRVSTDSLAVDSNNQSLAGKMYHVSTTNSGYSIDNQPFNFAEIVSQ